MEAESSLLRGRTRLSRRLLRRAPADIDKEISYMKISLNWRARVIATTFLESLARGVVSGAVSAPKLGAMTLARPPPE